MNTFIFSACGVAIRPREKWLEELLKAFFEGEIRAEELLRAWVEAAVRAGLDPQPLYDFAAKCLGIVGA